MTSFCHLHVLVPLVIAASVGCGVSARHAHTNVTALKHFATKQPSPAAGPLRLPGECVTPPQRNYVLEFITREAHPRPDREPPGPRRWRYQTQEALDVDGDGQMDVIVPHLDDRDCPHEVEYTIYIMRGTCGHAVGTTLGFPSLDESAGPQPIHRLRPLIAGQTWSEITDSRRPPGPGNVATRRGRRTRYAARDGVYRAGESTETAGICHHCGIATCRLISGP